MPNILILPTIDVFDNILAIVDTRSSSFDATQQGEVIAGPFAVRVRPLTLLHWKTQCLLCRLGCLVERSGTENIIFHTLSRFILANVIGLIQRIVRFVMRTEPKASYRTVQYEYAYRYTPNTLGVVRYSWTRVTIRFLVTTLTKALLHQLLSLARRPALRRILVVSNFFH